MKIISPILFLLFLAPLSWGSESLFAFLHDHKIGSKVSAGEEGFSELPQVKIFGQQFSAYHELNSNKSIRTVGLYLRSSGTDSSEAVLRDIFNQIRTAIVTQTGEAEAIDVPNFQDASERATTLSAWKNDESILTLKKIQSASRTEIVIQHSDLDYYTSNLGADTGAYLLPRLETKSGELTLTRTALPKPASIDKKAMPCDGQSSLEESSF